MKWFRQSKTITLSEQIDFMKAFGQVSYPGKIILYKNKRIGVGAIKATGELSLVLPTKYNFIRQDVINLLCEGMYGVWGEVFIGNPITKDMESCGFKPVHTMYVKS